MQRRTEYDRMRVPEARRLFCFAPSVNLNFHQNGSVTACCYNLWRKLGTWPADSLEAIWNGEGARRLREEMRSPGRLPDGCALCQEQLNAGNFLGMHAHQYDPHHFPEPAGSERAFPRIMEFELSNTCNLECVMFNGHFSSSIRHNREKLPPIHNPYDDAFVDQLEPFLPHLRKAKFLGGEPFLNPLYYKIWNRIRAVNPSIVCDITTNGTVLNAKVRRIVEELRPILVVSVDSLNEVTYERIRKNASYRKMRENLGWFVELSRSGGRPMGISVCPMRENWQDLPELVSFCTANDIPIYFNTVFQPHSVALRTLGAPELARIAAWLGAHRPAGELTGVGRANQRVLGDLIRQLEEWARLSSANAMPFVAEASPS